MFLYRFGYSSYEESPDVWLAHEKEYSQKEFEAIVFECLKPVMRQKIDNIVQRAYYRNEPVINFDDHGDMFDITFGRVWDDVEDLLVSDHGFSVVAPACNYKPFGWCDISSDDGLYWRNETKYEEEQNLIRVGTQIFDEYRKEIEDSTKNLRYETPIILVYGNTGCGKTTIVKELCSKREDVSKIVTTTTRLKRKDEVNFEDYQFLSMDGMRQLIDSNSIFEMTEYDGHYYATTLWDIRHGLNTYGSSISIVIVDSNGVIAYKGTYPNSVAVYIEAEDIDKNRALRSDDMSGRINIQEDKSLADHIIINRFDDRDFAISELERIIDGILARGISHERILPGSGNSS